MPLETRGRRAGSALYLTRVMAFPRGRVSIAGATGGCELARGCYPKAPILGIARRGVCESFHKTRG
jgi:hypothetical protein